jgi:hypothetical protein
LYWAYVAFNVSGLCSAYVGQIVGLSSKTLTQLSLLTKNESQQHKIETNHHDSSYYYYYYYYYEKSYVDAMEGRRSLRDVMRQIDGLGPTRHRNRRCPKRRSEVVSLMDGETNGKKRPLFVNEQTSLAPNARLKTCYMYGKMQSCRNALVVLPFLPVTN